MTLPPSTWPALLAAALGLTAVVELCTPLPSSELTPPISVLPAAVAQNTGVSAAAGAWSAKILQRPLFRPDRRPLTADAAVTAPMPRLSAIVITAAGSAAIFSGDDGKAVTVAEGGIVDGYRIASIRAGEVKITGPAGDSTLRPQFAPAAQSDAVPPPFSPAQRSLDNY